MSDTFSAYERGLVELLTRLGRDHALYGEALTFQSRLQENVAQAREFGDSETRRAERAQIVSALNGLALKALDVSFNELCGLPPPPTGEWVIPPCPYRGLLAFREEDAPAFFGRESFAERLLENVERRPLTVVLGASGSGKSSVLSAGLLPQLRPRPNWAIATLRPGRDPFQELAAALLPLLEPEMTQTDRLLEVPKLATGLQEGKIALDRLSSALLEKQRAERLLVVIDQFEELYTLCADEPARRAFLDGWLGALELPLRLLLTLRADFLGQALAYRPFANALDNAEKLLLGPMSPEQLQAAVVKPAEQLGADFEGGLVARILDDVGQEPGRLPLLEFALTQLWERQEQGRLTHRAYEAVGGVEGALVQHAEQVCEGLQEAERPGIRQILTQLVQPGVGTEDTRRRATPEELGAERWRLVQKLADARLVVTSRDAAGQEVAEVAHETLIGRWGRLRGWMAEDREFRTWQERLRAAMRGWEASGRDEGALLRGTPLAQAQEWLARRGDEVEAEAHAFVQASAEQVERERLGRERLRRRITLGLAAGLVVMVLLAVVAWGQRGQAIYEAHVRGTAQAEAEAQRLEAEQQRQVALARQWAAVGQLDFDRVAKGPFIGTALGIESLRAFPSLQADQLVRQGLALLPRPVARMRHNGAVMAVGFSPDGQWVVSASGDGTARVWEAATGQELARMQHDGNVMAVAFSPDGLWVVSVSDDSTVRVWEAATGRDVARMQHDGAVMAVGFSPDGRRVVSASADGTARVWEAATGQEVARTQHFGGVTAVAFSPDGRWVVSGGIADGTARVWEAATGQQVARMQHDGEVTAVAFSPDGRWVVSGSWDDTVRVWEAATGQEVARMQHDAEVEAVAFSPDGRWVVSAGTDYTARVWQAATGQEAARMKHDGQVTAVAFSPDGRWVVGASADETARVWEAATGREVARTQHDSWVTAVAFSPDGQRVVSGSWDGTARVWEAAPAQEVARTQHHSWVTAVAFSPVGQQVVSGSWDGVMRVWEMATGQEVARMQHDSEVTAVAFSPDGQRVVGASSYGMVRVWEAATGQEVSRMQYDILMVTAMALSPDGRWVVTGSGNGLVQVCEAATGKEVARMEYDGAVGPVAFSPDGRWVVIASGTDVVRVCEVATGQEVARTQHDLTGVTAMALSPDGQRVVSGTGDGMVQVWEAATGQEVARMQHDSEVDALAFSPDGRLVVSGCWDGMVRVWEAATGQEVARMQHDAEMHAVAFSPDGRWVVSGSGDYTARVWRLRPDDLISEACSRLPRNLTKEEWAQYVDASIPYRATCPNLPVPKE